MCLITRVYGNTTHCSYWGCRIWQSGQNQAPWGSDFKPTDEKWGCHMLSCLSFHLCDSSKTLIHQYKQSHISSCLWIVVSVWCPIVLVNCISERWCSMTWEYWFPVSRAATGWWGTPHSANPMNWAISWNINRWKLLADCSAWKLWTILSVFQVEIFTSWIEWCMV